MQTLRFWLWIGIPVKAFHAFGETLHVNVGMWIVTSTYIKITLLHNVYLLHKPHC